MKLFIPFLISSLFCLTSCKQTTTTQAPPTETESTTPVETKLFVSMSKTPCYGTCPTYSLSIQDNGDVWYNGKRFVEKEGIYTGKLNQEQIIQIKEQVKSTNFFELNTKYDNNATDIPSCIIEVTLDGNTKKITDRIGAPKELKELEKLIEELVFNTELKKVEE